MLSESKGRFHLKVNCGQLRRATTGRQKSSPFLVSSLSMPKCRVCTVFLPASAQSILLLFFSVTLFAINPHLAHCFFSFLKKINKPIHPKGKKDVCTPTATTVLHLRQKKNNSKLLYITCSYIRSPPDGETTGINIT